MYIQATIPGILCGPFTAELVTASHGRWMPVFVLAAAINFTGAIIYQTHSSSQPVLWYLEKDWKGDISPKNLDIQSVYWII